MIKIKYLSLGFAILAISHVQCKDSIESFVYINGYSVSIDSLNKVQFSLRKYLEYSPTKSLKIAKGPKRQYFYLDTISNSFKSDPAPKFGLDQYYKGDYSKTLIKLIGQVATITLSDTSYSCDNEVCDYNFFIFKYSNGNIKVIHFCSYCIPNEFQNLYNELNETINSSLISESNHFFVNDLVVHAQKYLFKILPPPPLPSSDFKNP